MATYRTPAMIAQVRSRVQQVSSQALSDAVVLKLLDEAQRDICLQVDDAGLGALGAYASGACTLDEEPYALPSDFLRERVVDYNNVVCRRWRIYELDVLDNQDDPFRKPSATRPFYYLWDGALYIRAGTKTAVNYHLWYTKLPAALTTTSNPALGIEFDGLMVTFAVARAMEPLGMFQESEVLWQEYLDRCALVNSRFGGGLPYDGLPGDRR